MRYMVLWGAGLLLNLFLASSGTCLEPEMQHRVLTGSYFSELVEHPEKYKEVYFGRGSLLADFELSECLCPCTGKHNRFLKGNTRTRMEKLVVEHVSRKVSSRPVRMLSLGSGGCHQDLMIILRLVVEGVKSIDVVLVEQQKNHRAYADFRYLLSEINRIYGAETASSFFLDVSDVGTERAFDVVYAIDYEEYEPFWDYSSRKLPRRTRDFNDKAYKG